MANNTPKDNSLRLVSETEDRRHAAPRQSTEDNILNAANRCFERNGIKGSSAEEIAVEAGVSRATLYRYFSSKEAIVDQISIRETERVKTQIREHRKNGASFEEMLVECLFLSTRIANKNPCVRALVQDVDFTSRTTAPSSPQQQAFMQSWGRLIQTAFTEGDVASDLNEEAVVNWLYISLEMLLLREASVYTSDEELRYFIKRFVVRPLLQS